jgi:hypothetical protein
MRGACPAKGERFSPQKYLIEAPNLKKGRIISRAGGKAPEEGKGQESYSGAPRVKLGSKVECSKTGVKLQGRLKLKMEAGFCKKTRGRTMGCRGRVVRRGSECGKSDRCSEGNHEE